MNSRMSGWSTSRITILAARRVLPPLLITPAKASKPRMKETGPEAVPPPARFSREERMLERFEPVPEPYLKSMPSVLARSRIEAMVSSTELMKQAEHWGFSSIADVEPDRRVEAGELVEQDVGELGVEGVGVLVGWRSSRPSGPSR